MARKKALKQKGVRLKLGDIVRILDRDMNREIAVVVEADEHDEWPWCCMLMNSPDKMRMEYWPVNYERLGNVVEMVGLASDLLTLTREVRKLVRSSSHGG